MSKAQNDHAAMDVPSMSVQSLAPPKSGMVKGVIVGGVGAFAVSAMFLKPAPSSASAAVLLPSLASIGSQISNYLGVMTDWVDQWIPDLEGIINNDMLEGGQDKSRQAEKAVVDANRESAAYHAQGGGKYRSSMNDTLGAVRNPDTGRIDPEKAASTMSPPTPLGKDEVNSEKVGEVWDHAALVTGDEPLKPVRESRQESLRGAEYEYKRIQTLQTRLLAQDSIQAYPLAGPKLEGYREHLEQVNDNGDIASLSPGEIAASQLEMSTSVEIPASIDQLESSLRQERMLGAMLAQYIQDDVNELIGNEMAR